jgi:GDPmannose 4,6-dehydratase
MKKKVALIYGITGQDGSYLVRFLLEKNYIIYGVKRRSSSLNTDRLDNIYVDIHKKSNFRLIYGDITDSLSVLNNIKKTLPDEIYNLAAQSHVQVSFEVPEYTANANALGCLRILDSIKTLGLQNKIKFYQAGTSEMFGSALPPQNEKTLMLPRSPYAVSKLYAHWITINYRESYKIFACNGILFNHESPVRGETFVTKKIVKALCKIKNKKNEKLFLGNIYSKRDWGHAKDYVEAMWKILQFKTPDDYVIATGKSYTVKEFVNKVCNKLNLKIRWKGKGLKEKCYLENRCIIEIDSKYFRPTEVDNLRGDAKKARKILNWKPKYNIDRLIQEMVDHEMSLL